MASVDILAGAIFLIVGSMAVIKGLTKPTPFMSVLFGVAGIFFGAILLGTGILRNANATSAESIVVLGVQGEIVGNTERSPSSDDGMESLRKQYWDAITQGTSHEEVEEIIAKMIDESRAEEVKKRHRFFTELASEDEKAAIRADLCVFSVDVCGSDDVEYEEFKKEIKIMPKFISALENFAREVCGAQTEKDPVN